MEESRRKFEVHGKVTGKNNRPIERAKVVVWWQQIRNRVELATGETSEDGRYHIDYYERNMRCLSNYSANNWFAFALSQSAWIPPA